MQTILFQASDLPVFQNKMFPTQQAALACATGNMTLVQDQQTGLIFNASFQAELLIYDRSYQNEQGISPVFQQHLQDVTHIIQRHFQHLSLLEVGCGKGSFLQHLRQHGFNIRGIDPAYEGCDPDIIKAHYTPASQLNTDAIVLRHVLEHIPNPLQFLQNLAHANRHQGKIYIEVPCFDWICQHRAWFDIFYEHVNYFCLDDFYRMFEHISEAGHLFGGQYLYVVAELSSLRPPQANHISPYPFPKDFLDNIQRFATLSQHKRNVIWSGASKGLIFSLYMQQAGAHIDFVVDINPAKQHLYLAKTGMQVTPPNVALAQLHANDNIFIMNSNYHDEIVAYCNQPFNYITLA